MSIHAQIFLFSVLILFTVSCANLKTAPQRGGDDIATKTILPVPGSRAGKGAGAVLLIADFKGIDWADDAACRWRVVNKDTKKSYFLNMKPGEPSVFTQLDPGVYETGRLGCGISRVWDLNTVFKDGFTVESGRVSYIGKLIFEFRGGTLDTVRKAPRYESAQAFAQGLEATPAGGMEAISGFTGRTIDRSMVEGAEAKDMFDVFVKGVANPGKILEPLVTTLKNCAKDEGAADPLRFGRLEYIAIYKQSRFSEMKQRQEANGFSDRLRSCVERGMMAFHPAGPPEVEVRVRY